NINGSELNGERANKGSLITHILDIEKLESSRVWMIGDRAQDIVGGRANGTQTIGVLWGYGSEEELMNARPDFLADSMADIGVLIDAATLR
ncbi:MAG TPA: HAD hydrolase-like protein, partial [Candidatus Kapabacteria bacterium]|nr:HAD hydrolase-like protein [Candidatus Kapabacteria bacterium]